ncbi:sulfatase [Nocardioides guangzhouensis]|uniref:Sulfatase n=1 Tax=Nocardioides guangzhouensis TaxID=2497878 RepID=A0A4Q4ZMB2_9ACTN|nr:sulfatase [Nocardioides guangzhouensis]RYP88594.1 sulfatase [Nocardioides guangzhouensis]
MNGGGVRLVQRRPRPGARAVGANLLTALAGLLVLAALTTPDRLQDLRPAAYLRLPLEALVYLAVVLALPPRLARLRTALAVVAGLVLGLAAVSRVLDMGFLEALNRPFDPLIDWHYAGALVETLRSSAGDRLGTTLLVVAVVAVVALLVLLPLAVLRLTRVAVRRRRATSRVVAGLASLWLVLALLQVGGPAGTLATSQTAGYVYGQVSRIPTQLRDQREFEQAARDDPLRDVPAHRLLTGLRGKDVLFVFVESYGRVAVEGSSFSPGVDAVLAQGDEQLRRAGFTSRSAYLTSPTFGALSWLAHVTLQTGLWADSQPRYDVLVTSRRLTLSRIFGRAGWRTVADVPANTRDWPQGAFYGYDHVYDSRNVGYRGPRFGYPTMPDQFTLDAFHRLELAPRPRRPVMAEIDLITSHAPWSRTPRMIPPSAVGDGSVYEGMPETLPSETDIWPSPSRVRQAYGAAIEYSLRSLVSFVTTYGDDDLVLVVLGDHQPATIVSGEDAGHDVPVSIIARDPSVLRAVRHWGWAPGLRPASDAPVWRMDRFRDRFLAAYGASQTGTG